LIAGLAYLTSGIDKLGSPSWLDGSAILHLLHNPLARDWVWREFLLTLSPSLISWLTWGTLALEIGFVVLCIFRKARALAWMLIMSMHLGILSLVSFADLTFGMLMIHFFTFDPRWFGRNPRDGVQKVVLFDGVCGMCNRSVDFFMSIDSRNLLKFSPLQGEFAAREAKEETTDLQTIVFYDDGKIYKRSTAVLRLLAQLGGIWSAAWLFLVIPTVLRDWIYGLIARNRYKFFGKREACRMPSKEEREKFLD
jgi:predicted DCC family thiol-disulfide oxidoreductase YuxK